MSLKRKLLDEPASDDDQNTGIILPVSRQSIYKSGIEDPQLKAKSVALLENVIPFVYAKDNTISLKLTFEQAFLLYEQEYDVEKQEAKFLINGRVFSTAIGDKFPAVGAARQKLCNILLYYCWTLKVRVRYIFVILALRVYFPQRISPFCPKQPDDRVKKTIRTKRSRMVDFKQNEIEEDNIGFKMLKSLGWTGGGLGVDNRGMIEPVPIAMKKGKEGIGIDAVDTKRVSMDDIKKLIDNYSRTGADVNYDLVFSPQFTKQDLHILEHYAIALNLSPLFFGASKFVLVISKKLTLQQIVQKVLIGDPYLTRKYEIVPPYQLLQKSADELHKLCLAKFANVASRKAVEAKKAAFGEHTRLVLAKPAHVAEPATPKPTKQLLGMTKKERKKEERLKNKHDPFKDGFKFTAKTKKDLKREKAVAYQQKQKGYAERFETPVPSCQNLFLDELAKYKPETKSKFKNFKNRKFNKR
jgi:G-patch domain